MTIALIITTALFFVAIKSIPSFATSEVKIKNIHVEREAGRQARRQAQEWRGD